MMDLRRPRETVFESECFQPEKRPCTSTRVALERGMTQTSQLVSDYSAFANTCLQVSHPKLLQGVNTLISTTGAKSTVPSQSTVSVAILDETRQTSRQQKALHSQAELLFLLVDRQCY